MRSTEQREPFAGREEGTSALLRHAAWAVPPYSSALGAPTASPADLSTLWWVLLFLGTAVFVVFAFLLGRGLFRATGDRPISHRTWLLGGGFLFPTVVIVVVFGFTVAELRSLPTEGGPGAVVIEVTGHQWWWEVAYPDHGFETANEIHLPVGRPVELRLRSADVIHSFWVPALGGKLDLLPERVNTLVLEADEPGIHRGVCAEFCGLQHANMAIVAVAEPPDQFARWIEDQQAAASEPGDDLAVHGREVFTESGCADCHTIRGTAARGTEGPDLTHLAGRLTLAAGTLPNTAEHLAVWVAGPQQVKNGVAMPDVPLTPDEIEALVAYLETLR